MSNNAGYVIYDENEQYIGNNTYTLTDAGWLYSCFTGVTTGFVWYNSVFSVVDKLVKLQEVSKKYGFNKEFHYRYINNIKMLEKGKLIIEKIIPSSYNKKIVNE